MNRLSRRQRFREVLSGDKCIIPASVYDAISARIGEDLGYEACMLGGSVASMAVCAAPDITVITLSELAALAYRICRASEVPLIVDADHGYGNALNVRRTVEELEVAGVAAVTIEDTLLPQPFGQDKPELVSIEEAVGKMRSALAARRDKTLAIVGRTNASIVGLDEAIVRARAYAEAGVDAIFVIGAQTRAEIDRVAQAVTMPLVVGAVASDAYDLPYLASRGARVCVQGHPTFSAAVRAAYETLKALRSEGTTSNVASRELLARLTQEDKYRLWGQQFLSGKPLPRTTE